MTLTFTSYTDKSPEKRMQGKIFEFKRAEVTEGWRKIHNEDLHNLY
jgi:hypothetical protein